MRTEIFIEGYRLDIMNDLPTEFTYAIDDIQDFGSKNTSFSKTINIPGSANNNQIFGFIFDLGNSNVTNNAEPNVLYNFNATKASQCRIFIDGIQIFKGILRVLEIVKTGDTIDYQCSVFGELGGFITALGNNKLEDLDFSNYDEAWNYTNITGSWDTVSGSGIYYPLIDIGQVSTNKIDFDFRAFKPSLYVKEYLEKILGESGYTWEFPLLETNLLNRLVIPNNQKVITKPSNIQGDFYVTDETITYTQLPNKLNLSASTLGSFTISGGNTIIYGGGAAITSEIYFRLRGYFTNVTNKPANISLSLYKNLTLLNTQIINVTTTITNFDFAVTLPSVTINPSDILYIEIGADVVTNVTIGFINTSLKFTSSTPTDIEVNYNDTLDINATIPKGIFQKDFFLSICKMFNLYVYEDRWDNKKILIKPYVDFYDGSFIDWSNKIDRSKPLSIKPMSEINARYYHFKYASDNDFYNENYKKKFNEGYADQIYDTEFDFVKNTDSTELIFAPSTLYQKNTTDKIYPAIYKLSNNNTTEDRMDFVVRILQAKKITSVSSWKIKNGATDLGTLTSYGYAGHLDDPTTPSNDINFGIPKEIYFSVTTYPTTNLFTAYYQDYMVEITDKDSKLLKCDALLNYVDIQNLDFSKLIMIDNILFRLNKVDGFSITDYKTCKLELLKVINKEF